MTDVPIFPDSDPPLDAWTVERLLADDGELLAGGSEFEAGAAELAALVAAARGPASAAELAGEAAMLAAYTEVAQAGILSPSRSRSRRSVVLSTFRGSKIALAAAAGGLSVAGFSAAAFANALPEPAQNFAHHAIGAPAAHHSRGQAPETTPVGPDAKGKAAYGLCTAYAAEQAHGKAGTHSIAFRNLATAAGGAEKIAAYCATVAKPGSTPSEHPTGAPTSHPTGPPTEHPTGPPTEHPTGPPTSHPTGEPTSHPTGPPVGR